MPLSKRDRLHQIHRWLQANYKTPFPTILRVERLAEARDHAGENYLSNGRIIIRVHKNLSLWVAVDTLFHEYAHVMTRRHDNIERPRLETGGHDAEWGIAYAKLLSDFRDFDGVKESRKY